MQSHTSGSVAEVWLTVVLRHKIGVSLTISVRVLEWQNVNDVKNVASSCLTTLHLVIDGGEVTER